MEPRDRQDGVPTAARKESKRRRKLALGFWMTLASETGQHFVPQNLVHICLVLASLRSEPGENVGVDPQADLVLDWSEETANIDTVGIGF